MPNSFYSILFCNRQQRASGVGSQVGRGPAHVDFIAQYLKVLVVDNIHSFPTMKMADGKLQAGMASLTMLWIWQSRDINQALRAELSLICFCQPLSYS